MSTAHRVAELRAEHQVLEHGRIFHDPLANLLLGKDVGELVRRDAANSFLRPLRLYFACRCRFAEDMVAAAVSRGVRQVVVLGAGLDTYAMRNPHHESGTRVYEVDLPQTQQWKRERLREVGFQVGSNVSFVEADFEHQSFLDRLCDAGLVSQEAAIFLWLGVSVYLAPRTVDDLVRSVGTLPNAELVLDYVEPPDRHPRREQEMLEIAAKSAAEQGEPWRCFLESEKLHHQLRAAGFSSVLDLSPGDIAARYFPNEAAGGMPSFPLHLVHARRA